MNISLNLKKHKSLKITEQDNKIIITFDVNDEHCEYLNILPVIFLHVKETFNIFIDNRIIYKDVKITEVDDINKENWTIIFEWLK